MSLFNDEPKEIWAPGLSDDEKSVLRLGTDAVFNFAKQYGYQVDEVSLTFETDAAGNLVPVVKYDQ